MRVVWQSFEGRYSDNPRALFDRWREQRPGDEHVWLAGPDERESFPVGVDTLPIYSPESVSALNHCDVHVANTHTDVEWTKKPGALYLQTWHGTPLKRVHRDVLWAPQGRLDRLSRDVARWDILLSPNAESTPRLRQAFGFSGEVLEAGYPRNDSLSSPQHRAIGSKVRHELGIDEDRIVVLYTPTWRDDVVLGDENAQVESELRAEHLIEQLGPQYCLLVRMHSMVGARFNATRIEGVWDVSRHRDISELYLAADLMITDYSSTMFDYAVTGRPIVFFSYDYERFRDTVRGFYFDLSERPPGPFVRTQRELVDAITGIDDVRLEYAAAYRQFRDRYCHLEDGHATERVLAMLWSRLPAAAAALPVR
jgi:CDP-glycerol glycerophosphotransferase